MGDTQPGPARNRENPLVTLEAVIDQKLRFHARMTTGDLGWIAALPQSRSSACVIER